MVWYEGEYLGSRRGATAPIVVNQALEPQECDKKCFAAYKIETALDGGGRIL